MSDFDAALANATLAGPADAGSIDAVEGRLNVSFPTDYRTFLSAYGAILGEGYEIAGVFAPADGSPIWTDVAAFTLRMRAASRGLLPREYVAIADDGGDYVFYLDTARTDERGVCPVVIMGPGRDGEKVADSFLEFLGRLARDRGYREQ